MYRVPVLKYLSLAGEVRLGAYKLKHQRVSEGYVLFETPAEIKRLQLLIKHHNSGEPMPHSGRKYDGPMLIDHRDILINVKRMNEDWYSCQCPACSEAGRDTKKNNLQFSHLGFRCMAGCEKKDVNRSFNKLIPQAIEIELERGQTLLESFEEIEDDAETESVDWKSVSAFLLNPKNEFVIVKTEKGWAEVGGKREGGESPIQTLRRETLEEVDVDVNQFTIIHREYDERTKSWVYVMRTPTGYTFTPQNEITDAKMCTWGGIWGLETTHFRLRKHSKVLKRALDPQTEVKPRLSVTSEKKEQTIEVVEAPGVFRVTILNKNKESGDVRKEQHAVSKSNLRHLWVWLVMNCPLNEKVKSSQIRAYLAEKHNVPVDAWASHAHRTVYFDTHYYPMKVLEWMRAVEYHHNGAVTRLKEDLV